MTHPSSIRRGIERLIVPGAAPYGAAAQMAAALDGVVEGIAIWDPLGRLVHANARLEAILGMNPGAAAPGMRLGAFLAMAAGAGRLDHADPGEALTAMESIVARRQAVTWDMGTADGHRIRVTVRPSPCGGWIGAYDDMTERLRAEERSAHLALHDPLTQLANRPHFLARLSSAIDRGGPVAVLFVDLDRFKEVNDGLGHPTGDSLLRAVASRLSRCFRHGDAVARLGGDEFAIALTRGEGRDGAEAAARRVIEALSKPFPIDDGELSIGATVGIAMSPRDGDAPDALIRAADMALYAAKSDSRGTHRFYDKSMGEEMARRRALEADLRLALGRGEIEMHYQPIVSVRTGLVTAMEALMRWRHPELGLVSPAEFIPIAEASRLVLPLGAHALRRACADAVAWPDRVKVAVNLSPVQFVAHDVVADVRAAIAGSGISPDRLEVEVTESTIIKDPERTRATLMELRALGVRIAMDDFGTGYSSLGQLRDFPFDKIKVDRTFVVEIGSGRRGAGAILKAVTAIATALGMETVAEGVETREQLAALVDNGCDNAQGWLFGKAEPFAAATRAIARIEATTRSSAASPGR